MTTNVARLDGRHRLRPALIGTVVAAALCVLVGSWTVVGQFLGRAAMVLAPTTLGVPFAWPPLRLTPLGHTTWTSWAIDTIAALVLLAVVFLRLRVVRGASRARAFVAGLWAGVLAVVAANLVRHVAWSFLTDQDLASYAVLLALTLLFSLVWGLVMGAALGLVHAIALRAVG